MKNRNEVHMWKIEDKKSEKWTKIINNTGGRK